MIATNQRTGKVRILKEPTLRTMQRVVSDGVDLCTGPCRCVVEPDGECPQGWPSRLSVAGYI